MTTRWLLIASPERLRSSKIYRIQYYLCFQKKKDRYTVGRANFYTDTIDYQPIPCIVHIISNYLLQTGTGVACDTDLVKLTFGMDVSLRVAMGSRATYNKCT